MAEGKLYIMQREEGGGKQSFISKGRKAANNRVVSFSRAESQWKLKFLSSPQDWLWEELIVWVF